MRQREDPVIMVTGQQPGALQGEPALGLEIRALRTGAMPTGVIPEARHMAVGPGLEMAAQGGGPALHDGARGSPDVGGQGRARLRGGTCVVENRVERHEGHRGLRTRDGTVVGLGVLQYHANYPRGKRLVQRPRVSRAWKRERGTSGRWKPSPAALG